MYSINLSVFVRVSIPHKSKIPFSLKSKVCYERTESVGLTEGKLIYLFLFRVRTVHYFVVNLRRHIFGAVLLYPYILSVLRNNILY